MKYIVLALSIFLSSTVLAEGVTPYLKLSAGYGVYKPTEFTVDVKNKDGSITSITTPLYEGDNIMYSIETGITIPTVDSIDTVNIGLEWSDLLSQGSSKVNNKPYYLDAFYDYSFNYTSGWYAKLGVGCKILEDTTLRYGTEKNEKVDIGGSLLSKITARLSVGYKYKDVEVSLYHHSQWLSGRPVNDEFEHYVTSLNVSYYFH